MAGWEEKELEWTYDYSKKVYEKQLNIEKAKEDLLGLMPNRSKGKEYQLGL